MPRIPRRRQIGHRPKGKSKDARHAEHSAARALRRGSASHPSSSPLRERTRSTSASLNTAPGPSGRVTHAEERAAIKVVWHNMGEPALQHGRGGTAAEISKRLGFKGDLRKVKRALSDIVAAAEAGEEYDPCLASRHGGRKRKLSDVECKICADLLAQGLGLSQTTLNINEMRQKRNQSTVSKTTVRDSVQKVVEAKVTKTKVVMGR